MILTGLADVTPAAERMATGNASRGLPLLTKEQVADCIAEGDIIAVQGTSGVIWAHFEKDEGVWYGRYLYGISVVTFKALARDLADELIARGHGATPVRWDGSALAAKALGTAFGIKVDAQSKLYTFTAAQGVKFL